MQQDEAVHAQNELAWLHRAMSILPVSSPQFMYHFLIEFLVRVVACLGLGGYDEPKTLPYQMLLFGPTGADVRHCAAKCGCRLNMMALPRRYMTLCSARSLSRKFFYPVVGDIDPAGYPNIVEPGYIVEEPSQSLRATWTSEDTRMHGNGHHFRSHCTFRIKTIESVFKISEKLISVDETSSCRLELHVRDVRSVGHYQMGAPVICVPVR